MQIGVDVEKQQEELEIEWRRNKVLKPSSLN
jgi:hypothetical protein